MWTLRIATVFFSRRTTSQYCGSRGMPWNDKVPDFNLTGEILPFSRYRIPNLRGWHPRIGGCLKGLLHRILTCPSTRHDYQRSTVGMTAEWGAGGKASMSSAQMSSLWARMRKVQPGEERGGVGITVPSNLDLPRSRCLEMTRGLRSHQACPGCHLPRRCDRCCCLTRKACRARSLLTSSPSFAYFRPEVPPEAAP